MCGIAGFLDNKHSFTAEGARNIGGRMVETLRHRGPDAQTIWQDESAGLVLGHSRLSIIDLSPTGAQPMLSACGRYALVYNGEAYNRDELRAELGESVKLKGTSDTEVVLYGCAIWGVRGLLERLNGMFAFAFWDKVERKLYLARDRFGEKPLYYTTQNTTFIFGSELKALRAHPHFNAHIDRNALTSFIQLSYVPAPYSIYENVQKLQAGSFLCVDSNGNETLEKYWDTVEEAFSLSHSKKTTPSLEELEKTLLDCVHRRMVADVPLGAFLSGGIDSSLVVAMMCQKSSTKVKTFAMGFYEDAYNEAPHAKAVAKHLGTDHTELYVTAKTTQDVIPSLADIYDEPFADSSQTPTHLVSKLAKEHVTVALTGDGGDELFYGYSRYPQLLSELQRQKSIPSSVRSILQSIPIDKLTLNLAHQHNIFEKGSNFLNRLSKLWLTMPDLYWRIISYTTYPELIVKNGKKPDYLTTNLLNKAWAHTLQAPLCSDTLTGLSDDMLVKVDRAAMFNSLETRTPFLDPNLFKIAWQYSPSDNINGARLKWPLREILYKYVPEKIVDRPKQGFGVPVLDWLRGPLRPWAEDLLEPSKLRQQDFFDCAYIHKKWQSFQAGKECSWLWSVLMFQAWLNRYHSV